MPAQATQKIPNSIKVLCSNPVDNKPCFPSKENLKRANVSFSCFSRCNYRYTMSCLDYSGQGIPHLILLSILVLGLFFPSDDRAASKELSHRTPQQGIHRLLCALLLFRSLIHHAVQLTHSPCCSAIRVISPMLFVFLVFLSNAALTVRPTLLFSLLTKFDL